MRSLMPLLRSLTWIRMYQRKELLDHRPIIMIVSRYTLARKTAVAKPYQSDWVTTSLWENPRCSSPKVSVPDLSDLVVILDIIVVLWFVTHTVFTGVLYYKPRYEYSLMKMSALTCTRQRCFPVRHWVTVAFLTPFLCVLNVNETLSARFRRPLLCGSSRRFL